MTIYSQNNAAWSNLKLGQSSWTMGQAGCLVCSMAEAATKFGHTVNPAQMLGLLEQHGLVDRNGDITRADALSVVFSNIKLVASESWPDTEAVLGFFSDAANPNVATILEIDDSPAPGMQTHFMVVEQEANNDVICADSWDGTPRNASVYGERWNPPVTAPRIIYAAWKFEKAIPVSPLRVTPQYVVVQPGWGLSNIAAAAKLHNPVAVSTYEAIAKLNGSDNWQIFNAELKPNQKVRVK